MRFLNKFVLLFEARADEAIEHELEQVLRNLDDRPSFKGCIRSTCILGHSCKHLRDYAKSYQEAKSLTAKKDILPNPKNKKVLSASSRGIYKFLSQQPPLQVVV